MEPNLKAIIEDLTIKGLRELIKLAQARLLKLAKASIKGNKYG